MKPVKNYSGIFFESKARKIVNRAHCLSDVQIVNNHAQSSFIHLDYHFLV